ncbi:MAG: hypothetical protein QGH25_00220 [Candidatus Latescibacteria bacterium]|nr:hypothetical protein [Candidatus Latescibacterota bacterium]
MARHRPPSPPLQGVDVVGTGDYTYPEWFAELSVELEPGEDGFYRLRAP